MLGLGGRLLVSTEKNVHSKDKKRMLNMYAQVVRSLGELEVRKFAIGVTHPSMMDVKVRSKILAEEERIKIGL